MLFGLNKKAAIDKSALTLTVNEARCPQNHACPSVRICPTGALRQVGMGLPTVDQQACTRCGKCVRFCPRRALVLK